MRGILRCVVEKRAQSLAGMAGIGMSPLAILYRIQIVSALPPARLNILMDRKLYRRLKEELPPRHISAFIEASVRARLAPDRRTLDRAYKAARKEKWRRQLAAEWASLDGEGWPS